MTNNEEIVMYIVVRNDLGMSPGKVAAQVGHGVELALDAGRRLYPQWIPQNAPCAKIVLSASYSDLEDLCFHCGYKLIIVIDEGRTEVPPDTVTVAASVPAPKREISSLFKHLKLYK